MSHNGRKFPVSWNVYSLSFVWLFGRFCLGACIEVWAPSEPSGGVKINILFVLPVFAAFEEPWCKEWTYDNGLCKVVKSSAVVNSREKPVVCCALYGRHCRSVERWPLDGISSASINIALLCTDVRWGCRCVLGSVWNSDQIAETGRYHLSTFGHKCLFW